jgi:hypothetical protein
MILEEPDSETVPGAIAWTRMSAVNFAGAA